MLALRHGSTGATAIRNSRASPIGIDSRSKYGAPTTVRRSCSASTSSGNTVPSRTTKANTVNSTLLARNAPSRESGESIVPGRAQAVAAPPDERQRHGDDDAEERQQVGPDRAVAEGVDARQDPGAGEERAEDRQRERGDEQAEVPDAQHPPPLLHEHRVDVRGAGQPRQEAGVLDRVPRPHPAPAEHLVAPPPAEQDADRQERPREQRPAAGLHQPALADASGDEGGDGEGERHGEPDVAEVEDRRVEQHEHVVLQQRVRAGAVGAPGRAVWRTGRPGRS